MAVDWLHVSPDEKAPEWIERLLAKLERLRQTDPQYLVHGAWTHTYRFGPRMTRTWRDWVERKYGIELPEQYRQFLIHAGNGGAGPSFGLQRFGYLENACQAPASIWTEEKSTVLYPSGQRWEMVQQYMPDGSLTDGFEASLFESMRALAGGDTILAESFPFSKEKNSNEEVFDRLGEVMFDRAYGGEWHIPGALHLCDLGCGIMHMLVLNGPWRGAVWEVNLSNDAGVMLAARSFEEWYDQWLESSFRYCARSLNYRRLLSLFATEDPVEASDLAATLQGCGIRCEVEGHPPRTIIVLVDTDQKDSALPLIQKFKDRRNH